MKKTWLLITTAGLLLVGLSVGQVLTAIHGLRVITFDADGTPVTAFLAQDGQAANSPVILIGHGFAGSGTVMRAFALTLAHAGYNVLTWDFAGHGANASSLSQSRQRDALVQDPERALRKARIDELVAGERVAVVGHSMGSGVALAYGQLHPDTEATIAISPVFRQVTPELPQNLLLLAGSQEPNFMETARQLLLQAGGEGGDLVQGTARRLVSIPGANHLTILFSSHANLTILEWLDGIFGEQPGATPYTDQRMAWYILGVAGTILAAGGLAWRFRPVTSPVSPVRPVWLRLAATAGGVFVATFVLWLLGRAGLELSGLFGLLVGGYLLIWFLLAGVSGLLILRTWPVNISIQSTLVGLLSFGMLWIGIGYLSHLVWLPWLMILPRLVLWPLAAVCILPWFLLLGEFVRGGNWLAQAAAWLAHSLLLLGGLFVAMQVTPGIGFLILIMPVFPIFFGLHALAVGPYRGGWPFALSGALFTAWVLLLVFPLQ
jgi:pimeloyl-ACP methyl ester carboxylesterase